MGRGIRLSPMIAMAAMALSSLSVMGNANRLRRFRPPVLPTAAPVSADLHVKVETEQESAPAGR